MTKNTQILIEQGWTEPNPGFWQPPNGFSWFPTEKAIATASDPDLCKILGIVSKGNVTNLIEEKMKPLFDENPPQIDVAQLRQLTEQAIQRGKEKEAKKLADAQVKSERQAKVDQLLAAKILAEVPDKCEREAFRERSHAIVMSLNQGRDYECIGRNESAIRVILPTTLLKGPALIVWNYLQEQKLNPSLEYWHDGVGMKSGYNIVVKW